ncbi:MAG: cytochrome c-type biogenesis protein CcmH [Thermoanaerobaculia bacterium]
MRSFLSLILLAILAALPMAAQEVSLPAPDQIVGAPAGQPLTGAALEQQTEHVAGLLRCPVCQGLSVYDSPAPMAINMKHQVRDLLAAGYTGEQITSYFEASYGEFVRLQPTMSGMNWIVWLAPIAMLGIGIWAVMSFLRRSNKAQRASEAAPDAGPEIAAEPDDPELLPYLLKVRELAYGWPGGNPPAEGDRS